MSRNFFSYVTALGIDDGYFPPDKKGETVIAGVLYVGRKPDTVALDTVEIDGKDATIKAVGIASRLARKASPSLRPVVFLDGVTYAGFNYVDPERLSLQTGLGVIIVFYKKPSAGKVCDALRKHFGDWEERWRTIGRVLMGVKRMHTRLGGVDYYSTMTDTVKVQAIVDFYQLYSRIPEPLRTAHKVASSASLFLRGKGLLK